MKKIIPLRFLTLKDLDYDFQEFMVPKMCRKSSESLHFKYFTPFTSLSHDNGMYKFLHVYIWCLDEPMSGILGMYQ